MEGRRIQKELSAADRYLDLSGFHRIRIRRVLKAARSAEKTREFRDEAGVASTYFPLYRGWLEERGYIDHYRRPTPKARPAKVPVLTKRGKGLLMVGEGPSLDSLVFEVDAGYRGTVRISGKGGNGLNVNQAATIMNRLDSGKCITVGGPQQHADELGGSIVLRYKTERADEEVMRLERKMWKFLENVLKSMDPKVGDAEIRSVLPRPPAYWLPQELRGSPDDRHFANLYNAYWEKRLEKDESERGNAAFIPEAPSDDPLSGHLFSMEGKSARDVLDSLKLGEIPKTLKERLEKRCHRPVSKNASLRWTGNSEKWRWELNDRYRIVAEEVERLDVYESGGPLPKFGWKSRRNILREIGKLARESEECRKWLKRHLDHDPNFFMPASFWRKVGFNIESEGSERVSPPYNTEPKEPKFLRLLNIGLLYVIDRVAEDPQKALNSRSEILTEYVKTLKKLQEKGEFYDLWCILRGSSGTQFTENTREFKHIKFFEPLEEATLRYQCEGKLTNLSRAYSDLQEEEKKTIEELSEAVNKGEYDLQPARDQKTDSSSPGQTAD